MTKSFEETYPTFHDYVREKFEEVSGVPFIDGVHVRQVCTALDRVASGKTTRLIISMPPRYGHTLLVSVLFPAYYLGFHPANHVISAVSEGHLARYNGKRVRQLTDADADGKTEAGGSYYSEGVGASLVGRSASLVVADNLSDEREAAIAITRPGIYQATYQWYESCLLRRLKPYGAVVSTHVRYGAEDVTGRLLKDNPEADVVKITALDENDESTWPEFWPTDMLRGIRGQLGRFRWNARYQQSPHLTFKQEKK